MSDKTKFSVGDKVKGKKVNIEGVVTKVWTVNPLKPRYTIVTKWGSQIILDEKDVKKA